MQYNWQTKWLMACKELRFIGDSSLVSSQGFLIQSQLQSHLWCWMKICKSTCIHRLDCSLSFSTDEGLLVALSKWKVTLWVVFLSLVMWRVVTASLEPRPPKWVGSVGSFQATSSKEDWTMDSKDEQRPLSTFLKPLQPYQWNCLKQIINFT